MKTMWWIFVSSIVLLILTGYQILWMFLHGLCHLLEKKVSKSYTSVGIFSVSPRLMLGRFYIFLDIFTNERLIAWGLWKRVSVSLSDRRFGEVVKLIWRGGWYVKMPFLRKNRLKYNVFYRFELFTSPVLVKIA